MVYTVVAQFEGRKYKILSQGDQKQFLNELSFTKRYRRGSRGIGPTKTAPDCVVYVVYSRRIDEYRIIGESVLLDVKADISYQFWYGLQLLSILYP